MKKLLMFLLLVTSCTKSTPHPVVTPEEDGGVEDSGVVQVSVAKKALTQCNTLSDLTDVVTHAFAVGTAEYNNGNLIPGTSCYETIGQGYFDFECYKNGNWYKYHAYQLSANGLFSASSMYVATYKAKAYDSLPANGVGAKGTGILSGHGTYQGWGANQPYYCTCNNHPHCNFWGVVNP